MRAYQAFIKRQVCRRRFHFVETTRGKGSEIEFALSPHPGPLPNGRGRNSLSVLQESRALVRSPSHLSILTVVPQAHSRNISIYTSRMDDCVCRGPFLECGDLSPLLQAATWRSRSQVKSQVESTATDSREEKAVTGHRTPKNDRKAHTCESY